MSTPAPASGSVGFPAGLNRGRLPTIQFGAKPGGVELGPQRSYLDSDPMRFVAADHDRSLPHNPAGERGRRVGAGTTRL